MVELLLDDGRVDVGARNQFPLLAACEKGLFEISELLMNHPYSKDKVDPSWFDNHAIRKVQNEGSERGDVEGGRRKSSSQGDTHEDKRNEWRGVCTNKGTSKGTNEGTNEVTGRGKNGGRWRKREGVTILTWIRQQKQDKQESWSSCYR
jgi:hypothetical protein